MLSLTIKKLAVCDEVAQLKGIYDQALAASDKAKKYFAENNLAPWDYGFNPSGEHVKLEWSGDDQSCEEPVIPQ